MCFPNTRMAFLVFQSSIKAIYLEVDCIYLGSIWIVYCISLKRYLHQQTLVQSQYQNTYLSFQAKGKMKTRKKKYCIFDARSIYIFIHTLDTTLTNIAAFTKRASKKSQQNTWPCQLKNASTSHPVNLLFDLKQSVSLNFSFRCFIISLILLQ